jgi:hypothetical protein
MGGWRPLAPKLSTYITPEGFAALQEQLVASWIRQRDVIQALAGAAALSWWFEY